MSVLNKYPKIKEALFLLDLDNGGVNRYTPKGSTWDVSEEDGSILEECEHFLSILSKEDLDKFICGERSEVEEEFLECKSARVCNAFLERMFNAEEKQ